MNTEVMIGLGMAVGLPLILIVYYAIKKTKEKKQEMDKD